MTEPIIRPFEDRDAYLIRNRDGEQVSPEQIQNQAAAGVAYTAVLDERPIGCAGVMIPWPGVGHAWMLLGQDIAGHEFWMFKMVKGLLHEIVTQHGLHRLESVALEDCPRNQRWQEGLGFTKEANGIARQLLSNRRSMIRYEWVKET